ncbi:Xanthine/uracil permease family protein [Actinidia rufa]|uniref:Xanthine/uracil permease family protein n=1 Tax=Actinidia rufa TaxID=165716 RepID=A0A7J0GAM5_9ERIC|nr:Xanthine/uracil permease family protein [Actinidia rufa]
MAGKAAPAKAEEPAPHPPKDQLPNVAYCITSPPPWRGEGEGDPDTTLCCWDKHTLLQTLFGTRLPAVIGGSYTFVAATISIILSGRFNDTVDPIARFKKTMRAIQGALLVASTLQIVLGFSGLWRNVTRFLSPLSAVPLVALTGFGLYEFGFPGVAKCIEIGLPQLVVIVFVSQYLGHLIHRGKHVFERFAVIFSVVIVWIYAHLLTVGGAYDGKPPKTQASCRTDRAGLIDGAPWIRVPYPFQWGAPSFDAGEAFAMMVTSFVALVEVFLLLILPNSVSADIDTVMMNWWSTGGFIAVSRYASATYVPSSVISRGVGWQGIGILISGMFGTVTGSSVSIENAAGLLALTRVGSRRVVQISAGFMIFFSILGKFGAVFASIPAPIVGALYCLFFAYYFNEYTAIKGYGPVHSGGRWFNDMINVPFSSEAFVAGLLAYFLDNTIHKKDIRKDRGKHWWDKFRSFKTDSRSEEFYSLPFNLNKYFPSV